MNEMPAGNSNHGPDCPWHGMRPATIQFCEAELCAWVRQPANAWSNLGCVIVGYILIRRAARQKRPMLAALGWLSVVLGLGSFWFHASGTWLGEQADLNAMYLVAGFVLMASWHRTRPLPSWLIGALYGLIVVGLGVLSWTFPGWGSFFFALVLIVAGVLEIRLALEKDQRVDYRAFWSMIAAFAFAFGAWLLDFFGIMCDPDRHWFSGHALWHVAAAVSIYWMGRFYVPLASGGDAQPRGLGVTGNRKEA